MVSVIPELPLMLVRVDKDRSLVNILSGVTINAMSIDGQWLTRNSSTSITHPGTEAHRIQGILPIDRLFGDGYQAMDAIAAHGGNLTLKPIHKVRGGSGLRLGTNLFRLVITRNSRGLFANAKTAPGGAGNISKTVLIVLTLEIKLRLELVVLIGNFWSVKVDLILSEVIEHGLVASRRNSFALNNGHTGSN